MPLDNDRAAAFASAAFASAAAFSSVPSPIPAPRPTTTSARLRRRAGGAAVSTIQHKLGLGGVRVVAALLAGVLLLVVGREAARRFRTFTSCDRLAATPLPCFRPSHWAALSAHPEHLCAHVLQQGDLGYVDDGDGGDGADVDFASLSYSTSCRAVTLSFPDFLHGGKDGGKDGAAAITRLQDAPRPDPSKDVNAGGWRMRKQLEMLAPVLRAAPTGAVVVDCGAFWGLYTQLFLALNPTVRLWVFNPVASHRAWLSRNLLAALGPARFASADVCVAPHALDSEASDHYVSEGARSSVANWGVLDQHTAHDQQVTSVSFRNWLASLGADGVWLLKLEAGGVEPHIVRCADDLLRQGRVKHILARSHSAADHADLLRWLTSQGFALTVVSKPGGSAGEGAGGGTAGRRGAIFGVWQGGKAVARAKRLRAAAAASPDAAGGNGKPSCSKVPGKERCCCSGASTGADLHSDPAYGTHCASWEAADEEPWCVVDRDACGADAFESSTNEVYNPAGGYWAHAPCKELTATAP